MSRAIVAALACALSIAASAAPSAPKAPAPPAWVQESNENAKVLLDVIARFSPESASQIGVDGYDEAVVDLGPKVYERSRDATEDAVKELKKRLERARDPSVKQDLEILIQSGNDSLETARLEDKLLVPYYAVARMTFRGIRILLDPRNSPERQARALGRLRAYAGLAPKATAIATLARARTEEKLGKGLTMPFKGEVEQDLADAPHLVDGLKQLFAKSGLKGWEEPMAALEQQINDYEKWVSDKILPAARTDHRLPPELYADSLKQYGVDIAPDVLMQRALVSFVEIQNQMKALAPLVAKQKGLKTTDYREVIKSLKAKQLQGKAILPFYKHRLEQIEAIVRRENIVTLPERKASIRLASEAESAIQPAPNMQPPRLIGNTGEYGEFVLPLVVPGKNGAAGLRMDDFTNEAASWTLTSHEARPGHELQFSAMVEHGVSTARAVFAFNSVNVEGWALYAEAEMQPYEPLDGQLVTLQNRLMRAARAFLDPMVNLGMLTPEQVHDVLVNDVVMSEGLAKEEVDRFTFRAPGQATSYFYGYQRLLETRERAQLALAKKFDRKAFNDFVLSQGLLPPALLQKAVMEDFVPRQRG